MAMTPSRSEREHALELAEGIPIRFSPYSRHMTIKSYLSYHARSVLLNRGAHAPLGVNSR